jgi:hypothetical protein
MAFAWAGGALSMSADADTAELAATLAGSSSTGGLDSTAKLGPAGGH